MLTAERPKSMHVRRTILCLATIFFWAAHDPDVASGQSSELMEDYLDLPESDLPESEPDAVVAGQAFKYPLLKGYRLNACLYQQEGCGEEAASKWCEARGFAGGAASFEIDENIGSLFPTLALGDLQLCANFVCDGFKEITCLP
jgi:hypothetical protein